MTTDSTTTLELPRPAPVQCSALFGGWISVHESLPEHLQKVLFCYADGENESAWYRYPTTMQIGDFYRESPTEATFRHDCRPVNNKNVAWWMPIPKPPNH